MKTKIKKVLKAVSKVSEKTLKKVSSILPTRIYSRNQVLNTILDEMKMKKNEERKIDLTTLKNKAGKKFSDLVSSQPYIGTTTRQGMKENGYIVTKVFEVKTSPTLNKKLYRVFNVKKIK